MTAKGTLAVHVDRGTASWRSGKTTTTLTYVPPDQNKRLIFTQLGIYDGIRFGTPCD